MTTPNAETLMAYADGELDATEAETVRAYLTTDAAARAEVESLRRTAALAKAAFEPIAHAPVPDRLIDAVLQAPTAPPVQAPAPQASKTSPSNVVPLSQARRSGVRSFTSLMPMAAAACLTLLVAGAAAFWWHENVSPTATSQQLIALGPVSQGSALAEVLEAQPSGVMRAADAANTTRVGVVATFRDKANRVCREVEVLLGASEHRPVSAGVACREATPAGTWIVEGAARVAQAPTASGEGYVPSGAAESDALDGLLRILGAQASLSPEDEQALLQRQWQ